MSFLKKHAADAADLTNHSSDHAAEAVDAVMKKYDRESNVRVWEGTPKQVIRFLMAAFSLYCIYLTLFDRGLPEVRLFFGYDHFDRIFELSGEKRPCEGELHPMV